MSSSHSAVGAQAHYICSPKPTRPWRVRRDVCYEIAPAELIAVTAPCSWRRPMSGPVPSPERRLTATRFRHLASIPIEAELFAHLQGLVPDALFVKRPHSR
jgi:hypothetical protein